jgi:hypothetical protein
MRWFLVSGAAEHPVSNRTHYAVAATDTDEAREVFKQVFSKLSSARLSQLIPEGTAYEGYIHDNLPPLIPREASR